MTAAKIRLVQPKFSYFGGTRSKGFSNVSKLTFFDKIGHAKSIGFRFYSATFSRKKELLFWLSRGLNRLTYVTRQIKENSKLRD